MTEPTDAEIWQMWMPMVRRMGVADPVEFARAVLAKWGAPAQKTNQCGEVCERAKLCAICAGGLEDTQPQAGAVPLTCEWTHNADDSFWDTECGQSWRFDDGGPKENHMNFCHCCGKTLRIKGGRHGTE